METTIELTIKGVKQEFKADIKDNQDITNLLWEVRTELKNAIHASNSKL